ncbi:MAG TPA: NAD-dependent epimerase/dehydratase family protein [Polyangiales bacterium]
MKVGVLGATGMIGQHTAHALVARGHTLAVLHRASSDLSVLKGLPFERRQVDIDDTGGFAAQLRGLDGLIHCAGYYPTVPAPWRAEVATALAQMTRVLDAAQAAKLARIVYVGAAIALPKGAGDPARGDEALSYATNPPDRAPYVQVKWAMDKLARERAAAGLPLSIAIPAMCFGEYDRGPTTGRLITDIANHKLRAYIRGNRNVVYTGDAARGIALVLERGRPAERYLLTGTDVSMDELVPLIARLAYVPPPTRVAPLWLAKALGKIQELRYTRFHGPLPTLSSTAIAVLASGQFLDGSKAGRELGYEPEVSLEDAIRRALDWFLAEGYVARERPAAPRPPPNMHTASPPA